MNSLRQVVPFALCLIVAGGAQALVIHPIFDSSITSLANASVVENSFNQVAQVFENNLTGGGTVNVGVSWGKINGYAMRANDIGESQDLLYGYYSFAQIAAYETSAASRQGTTSAIATALAYLPSAAPSGVLRYVVPSAEAKALGIINPNQTSNDGYVGFGSGVAYTFDPTNGVAAGTYDFQAVVAHELDEVLGRMSGLSRATPTYRTLFDLLRYSAPGQLSLSYNSAAYFSTNGGLTNEGQFNISSSGGDRSDWANSGSTYSDIQNAFLTPGQHRNLSAADLAALDALGYGGVNAGSGASWSPTFIAQSFVSAPPEVPEPQTWSLMLVGVALTGSLLRRRPRMVTAN